MQSFMPNTSLILPSLVNISITSMTKGNAAARFKFFTYLVQWKVQIFMYYKSLILIVSTM